MQPLNFGSLQNAVGTWAANKRTQNERLRQEQIEADEKSSLKAEKETEDQLYLMGAKEAAKNLAPVKTPFTNAGQLPTAEQTAANNSTFLGSVMQPDTLRGYQDAMKGYNPKSEQEVADEEIARKDAEEDRQVERMFGGPAMEKWRQIKKENLDIRNTESIIAERDRGEPVTTGGGGTTGGRQITGGQQLKAQRRLTELQGFITVYKSLPVDSPDYAKYRPQFPQWVEETKQIKAILGGGQGGQQGGEDTKGTPTGEMFEGKPVFIDAQGNRFVRD